MVAQHEFFRIQTEMRPSFIDVTGQVKEIVSKSGIQEGIVVVFSQHTTCSVIIQEDSLDTTYNGVKYIHQDLLDILDKIIPLCKKEGQYLHPGPKCVEYSTRVIGETPADTLNTDAHLRSSIMGRSETIPITKSEIMLGEHGHIYFIDFDGTRPRERIVRVQLIGE